MNMIIKENITATATTSAVPTPNIGPPHVIEIGSKVNIVFTTGDKQENGNIFKNKSRDSRSRVNSGVQNIMDEVSVSEIHEDNIIQSGSY